MVRVEAEGGVRIVTLDRPPVNALNGELIGALQAAVDEADADPATRVVVLYGGENSFSAGADIREFSGLAAEERRGWIERGARLCDRIEGLDKPVIAAICGHCYGGGLEVAMACHVRIVSSDAKLGQPEVQLGIPPGFGGTRRLPRLVPPGIALEMLLTGDPISAHTAQLVGLANHTTHPAQTLDRTLALARKLARGSASAQAAVLRILRGVVSELDAIVEALGSPDAREGTRAFLEKRPPRFEGA